MSRADDRAERRAERELEERLYGPTEAARRERPASLRRRRHQDPTGGGPVHDAQSLDLAESKRLLWLLNVDRPEIGDAQALRIVQKAQADAKAAQIDAGLELLHRRAAAAAAGEPEPALDHGLSDDPFDPWRFIDRAVSAWTEPSGPRPSPTGWDSDEDLLEAAAAAWNKLGDDLKRDPDMSKLASALRLGSRSNLYKAMRRRAPRIRRIDVIRRAAELLVQDGA